VWEFEHRSGVQNDPLPIVKDEFDMAQRASPLIGNANAAPPAIASAMVATMVQTTAHLFQFNWQASPEAASTS